MDLKDLMVGDWANVKGKPVKVTLDDLRTMLILFEDVDFHIEPIPLTEDILVKNGFRIQVTDDNSKWLWVTDNSWLAYSKRHNYWYYEDMKITYVHQLQHLLRLCGVQKEIEL